MSDSTSRISWPGRIAWIVAGLLLVLVSLSVAGVVDLRIDRLTTSHAKDSDYARQAQILADSDRSQQPHMKLEAQYPGPLQDTTIQRWRDAVDGTVCYIYLPIAVAHTPGPAGLVQYGSANVGSISCFQPR
jgi:hypothetical protein